MPLGFQGMLQTRASVEVSTGFEGRLEHRHDLGVLGLALLLRSSASFIFLCVVTSARHLQDTAYLIHRVAIAVLMKELRFHGFSLAKKIADFF